MSKFISKQKFSFHNGAQEFVIPLNEPVEVPAYVQEHFLFRIAVKAGVIIELAGPKALVAEAKVEPKALVAEANLKTTKVMK